jgi:hypothetical protein
MFLPGVNPVPENPPYPDRESRLLCKLLPPTGSARLISIFYIILLLEVACILRWWSWEWPLPRRLAKPKHRSFLSF